MFELIKIKALVSLVPSLPFFRPWRRTYINTWLIDWVYYSYLRDVYACGLIILTNLLKGWFGRFLGGKKVVQTSKCWQETFYSHICLLRVFICLLRVFIRYCTFFSSSNPKTSKFQLWPEVCKIRKSPYSEIVSCLNIITCLTWINLSNLMRRQRFLCKKKKKKISAHAQFQQVIYPVRHLDSHVNHRLLLFPYKRFLWIYFLKISQSCCYRVFDT
jgi:hypothetical protein